MQHDIDMLNQIRQNVQMGQLGIRAVMPGAGKAAFHDALKKQYQEYDRIHTDADSLLRRHRGKAEDLPMMARMGAKMSAYMQRKQDPTISKIAEMMIQGNTKGVVKSMRTQRQLQPSDPQVSALAQDLLQTEQKNIDMMKKYL